MIIQIREKKRLRPAAIQDVRKNNLLIDGSGTILKILEITFGSERQKMLIQSEDKRKTIFVLCDTIGQYKVFEC